MSMSPCVDHRSTPGRRSAGTQIRSVETSPRGRTSIRTIGVTAAGTARSWSCGLISRFRQRPDLGRLHVSSYPAVPHSGPRVCLMINIQQSLLRDVGVNLGCRQISVTEQFLDAAEVGSAVEQVGGEAVPQRVRAGRVHQAGTQQVCLQ